MGQWVQDTLEQATVVGVENPWVNVYFRPRNDNVAYGGARMARSPRNRVMNPLGSSPARKPMISDEPLGYKERQLRAPLPGEPLGSVLGFP